MQLGKVGSAALLLSIGADASAQGLRSTIVATGLDSPIAVAAPPNDVRRLFVLERPGRVRIVVDGAVLPTPFLDISNEVSTAGEGGLLGIAFHPDFAHNKRFFLSFSNSAPAEDPVVREYTVGSNPNLTDPASGVDIFGPYPHDDHVHYASDLQFGLDGKLYYSLGHAGFGAPQSLSHYDGKLLRIDVDRPAPHVPPDNPFAAPNDGALDLIWALGLRNPYRFAIDRLTGDLYLGDVGRNDREEVDFQPASVGVPGSPHYTGGRNYGWPCMEGTLCTPATDCACDPSGATITLPVHEFGHSGPTAVIGGHVYRGSAIPNFHGRYLFGEFVSGRVWSFGMSNGSATDLSEHTSELQGFPPDPNFSTLSSFGEDANGELYVTSLAAGIVYRIDPSATPCPAPTSECTTSPNSVGSGAVIGTTGSTSIAAAELTLTARHCPSSSAGVFFHGSTATFVAFGNGARCVGGSLVRMPIVHCDELGNVRQAVVLATSPFAVGATRQFQFFYRDPLAGGASFDFSDARRVVFCP